MKNFADRLIKEIFKKENPCIVGLDPRLHLMPHFITKCYADMDIEKAIQTAITHFHEIILDVINPLVPAVKLQIAFYEQYGLAGLKAFGETIQLARDRGLLVIVDAKRNDIASTAQAYANAFLGQSDIFDTNKPIFDVDCITVSPFLGRDSLEPFVNTCKEFGKGIFILVKTSNPGSVDLQDQEIVSTGQPLYESIANLVNDLGKVVVGESGYSAIGAVVGATFPEEATKLRHHMPRSIILVPGYGAQGGKARDTIACFNDDELGAVVNASRSITYSHKSLDISKEHFIEKIQTNTKNMIKEITTALKERTIEER